MHSRVSYQINLHTAKQGIVTSSCDVFEELVLAKLAGITTKPTFCQFDTCNSDQQTWLDIRGISEKEANLLLDYFKKCGDEKATQEYFEPCVGIGIPEQNDDVFHFTVDTGIVLKTILPAFIKAFDEIAQNSPQDLKKYQSQCANDDLVEFYQLKGLINDIIECTAYLQNNNSVDEILKTDFDRILTLIDAAIKGYNDHLQHRDCNVSDTYGDVLLPANELYSAICNDPQSKLHSDEKAKQLQSALHILSEKVCTSKLGIFGDFVVKKAKVSTQSMEQDQTANQNTQTWECRII